MRNVSISWRTRVERARRSGQDEGAPRQGDWHGTSSTRERAGRCSRGRCRKRQGERWHDNPTVNLECAVRPSVPCGPLCGPYVTVCGPGAAARMTEKLKIAIVHECSVRIPFHLTADTPSPQPRFFDGYVCSPVAQIRSESDRAATPLPVPLTSHPHDGTNHDDPRDLMNIVYAIYLLRGSRLRLMSCALRRAPLTQAWPA